VSLVLPGRGTVWLGPLALRQYGAGEDPLATGGDWESAGWLGGVLGTLIGLLGALAGTLAGSGRAPRFTLALVRATVGLGGALLLAGAIAAILRQPAGVVWTLLLAGGLTVAIFLPGLGTLRRRLAARELRRMEALDAR